MKRNGATSCAFYTGKMTICDTEKTADYRISCLNELFLKKREYVLFRGE